MVVKYKLFEGKCRFLNAIKIYYRKHKLRLRRLKRWVGLIFNKRDVILYSIVTVLWMGFALISNVLANHCINEYKESFFKTIWNLRSSIFTSVVLAFSIGTYNRVIDYRRALKKQYWIYLNTMSSFERILDSKCNSPVRNYYHYFYNKRCFNLTLKMWDNSFDRDDLKNLQKSIKAIENRLDDIKREFVNGEFILRDEFMFSHKLDYAYDCINKLLDEGSKEVVKATAYELYGIVDFLRKP